MAAGLSVGLCASGDAFAQAGPIDAKNAALAESLFDAGRDLMADGRYAEACPKLAESYRLDPAGGTLLNLAVCYERGGQLASAYTHFQEAERLAKRDGRDDRAQIAREKMDALRDRISTLAIHPPTQNGIEIELDGVIVPPAAYGVPAPIDGGAHTVAVRASGYQPTEQRVDVKPEKDAVVVRLPALVPAQGAIPPVAPPLAAPPPAAPPPAQPCVPGFQWDGFGCSPAPTETRISTSFWVNSSIAAGFAAAGTITGVVALSDNSEADELAQGGDFAASSDAYDRALVFGWISTGAFAVTGIFALLAVTNIVEDVPVNQPQVGLELLPTGARFRF